MNVVTVATADSRAYYSIVSRLKATHLKFVSVTPAQALKEGKEPILTTKKESEMFADLMLMIIEDLDESPIIMEGQILANMLSEPRRMLLIGVDPGSRIGVVAFYGGNELGSFTVNSVEILKTRIFELVDKIPNSSTVIKIGDGAHRLSESLARALSKLLPKATIEMVDEKGTSISNFKGRKLTRDQSAAARIAFRKGVVISSSS